MQSMSPWITRTKATIDVKTGLKRKMYNAIVKKEVCRRASLQTSTMTEVSKMPAWSVLRSGANLGWQ